MKKILSTFILCVAAVTGAMAQPGVYVPGDYKDGVYEKENALGRNFIPYTHLREADVTWEKRVWRSIDVREKINQPLYFPITDVVSRKSLIQIITRGVFQNKIIAFTDEEFMQQYDPIEFRNKFVAPPDSTPSDVYDSLGNVTTIMVLKPIDSTWFYQNFCRVDIKEDWFFDRQKSVLEVRIIGLGFGFLPRGKEDAGCQPFFFVYFPACRPLFAKNEVFNVKNDSERRTFEDIFWKRQFASAITKESNVFDRKISDYAKGLDALLESDRIKGDIFRLEHDLWQF